jgi:hypothetical protein
MFIFSPSKFGQRKGPAWSSGATVVPWFWAGEWGVGSGIWELRFLVDRGFDGRQSVSQSSLVATFLFDAMGL